MKTSNPWRALAAIAALSALAACGEGGDAAETGPQPVTVGPENVSFASLEEISTGPAISGTLEAERAAAVRAEVGGSVLQVYVEPGERVRAGQPLVRIEDAGIGDAAISARAAVRTAEIGLTDARRNLERAERLAAAGAISDRDLESARTAVAAAESQLEAARAQAASAERQLGNTTVRVPISGVVSERPVNAGDVVQPGTELATVIDPGSMELEASVPAAQVGALQVGAPVRFTVTGYARPFTGTIRRISPAADPVTRQVPIYVSVPNEGGALVAGLFAEGRVEAETRRALVIPASAVDEAEVSPVVVQVREGKAARVPVELGIRDPETGRVEVVGGLAAGDTVLTGAATAVSSGTPVRIGRAGSSPAPAAGDTADER